MNKKYENNTGEKKENVFANMMIAFAIALVVGFWWFGVDPEEVVLGIIELITNVLGK